MTTREKIDLMTKINVANEQRIAEYLINGHEFTMDSPITLDLASIVARRMRANLAAIPDWPDLLRKYAEYEGYDPDIIENAVRSVGGQH